MSLNTHIFLRGSPPYIAPTDQAESRSDSAIRIMSALETLQECEATAAKHDEEVHAGTEGPWPKGLSVTSTRVLR